MYVCNHDSGSYFEQKNLIRKGANTELIEDIKQNMKAWKKLLIQRT